MKSLLVASIIAVVPLLAAAADSPPDWAFPPNGSQPPADDGQPQHVPGSNKAYTYKQVNDTFAVPDWFPDEHPSMPDIVAHGRAPNVNGCALCHLANGQGHPESANLAGLPAAYIEEQIASYKNGDRQSSQGRSAGMVRFAKAMADDDVKQAAAWFASLKQAPWTKVTEAAVAPKTFIGQFGMRFKSEGNETEPLGRRIIEFPIDQKRVELRDPHASFDAYVPAGSIVAGQKLATTGGDGKTVQCSGCHGADLEGNGNVPGIAGRSPVYIFRQLYDIQRGAWKGAAVSPMLPVVRSLDTDDMIALAAYVASRQP